VARSTVASAPRPCPACSPRSAWSTARHQYGGTSFELFAKISEKNHSHSTLNPLAAYTKEMSLEQIMGDIMIAYPNTRPMCSANCDGAAAAWWCERRQAQDAVARAAAPGGEGVGVGAHQRPVAGGCQVLPDVNTLTRNAAEQAYEQAGVGPDDLDLVELHDCFATAELVHYDNLMLCEEGGAVDFFESGAPWRDGRLPVNVSGGLQSKGHPISATGIANIWEVCQHLRGEAGPRQIEGAKVGLAHVIGLGSACGVHILEGIATTAVRDGDEYVLNGSKTFITNGINSDLIIVAAKTDPSERHAGMSLMVVERGMPGFERGRNLEKIGMHSQDTAELFFNDVRVPVANLLGEEGKGFNYLTGNLAQERLSIAVTGQATAKAALDWTVEYVKERPRSASRSAPSRTPSSCSPR
jgi:hypothetical protein